MYKKSLVFGIVVLFVGASILPSTLGKNEDFIDYNKPNILFVDPPDEDWNKTFGGVYYESGRDIKQTTDGGYIITGYTYSYGAGLSDAWLLKLDASGNYEWDSTFGGSDEDAIWSVAQTSEGGYILAGETESYGAGKHDLWLVKADSNGNHLWNHTYGLTGGDNLIALNNIFANCSTLAMKNVDGDSIAAYNLFWGNTSDHEGSVIDPPTTLYADPLLDANYDLQAGRRWSHLGYPRRQLKRLQ